MADAVIATLTLLGFYILWRNAQWEEENKADNERTTHD